MATSIFFVCGSQGTIEVSLQHGSPLTYSESFTEGGVSYRSYKIIRFDTVEWSRHYQRAIEPGAVIDIVDIGDWFRGERDVISYEPASPLHRRMIAGNWRYFGLFGHPWPERPYLSSLRST